MKGGAKVVIEPHRHDGVFVAKAKEDALVTKNLVSGESVYGEKRISVDVRVPDLCSCISVGVSHFYCLMT